MSKKKRKRVRSKFTKNRLIVEYAILRVLISFTMKRIHRFYHEKDLKKIKGPYLLLANHNMDMDAVLVGIAFKRHMFFVSSDHILRNGFLSKLLIHLIAPISRVKGKTDAYTVIQMMESLRQGNNVCMFAEGNRSFNGLTGEIPEVTAKVIKKARTKVITYRIRGGYFVQPRWGFSIRKGKCTGEVVNIYEKEQINELSIDELNARIREDLYVDAYQDQLENPIRFRGRNKALGMETALFMCPACKKIGNLTSFGNGISCTCGWEANYTEYGMLENVLSNIDTITKWDALQRNELGRLFEERRKDEKPLFMDAKVHFYRVNNEQKKYHGKNGSMVAYTDRVECCGEVLFIKDIPTFSIYGRNTLTFMYNNEHCEIKGERFFSALKYSYLFELVKQTSN